MELTVENGGGILRIALRSGTCEMVKYERADRLAGTVTSYVKWPYLVIGSNHRFGASISTFDKHLRVRSNERHI